MRRRMPRSYVRPLEVGVPFLLVAVALFAGWLNDARLPFVAPPELARADRRVPRDRRDRRNARHPARGHRPLPALHDQSRRDSAGRLSGRRQVAKHRHPARPADRCRHRPRQRRRRRGARHLSARDDARDEQHPPGSGTDLLEREPDRPGAAVRDDDLDRPAAPDPVGRRPVARADDRGHARARVHDVRPRHLRHRREPPRLGPVRAAGPPHGRLRLRHQRARRDASAGSCWSATRARRISARATSTCCPRSPSSSSAARRSSAARARTCRRSPGALLITVITSILASVNVEQSGKDILYGAIILAMAFVNQVALGDRTRMGGALAPARRRSAAGCSRVAGGPTPTTPVPTPAKGVDHGRPCGIRHRRRRRHRQRNLPGVLRCGVPRRAHRPRRGGVRSSRSRDRSLGRASDRDRLRRRLDRQSVDAAVAACTRAVRAPRLARERRRRRRPRAVGGAGGRELGSSGQHPPWRAFRCSRAAFPALSATGAGLDRQHLVDRRANRVLVPRVVLRCQGGHRGAHPGARGRVGEARSPRQRDRPGARRALRCSTTR